MFTCYLGRYSTTTAEMEQVLRITALLYTAEQALTWHSGNITVNKTQEDLCEPSTICTF